MGFYFIKEVILIGREEEFAFIINGAYCSFCFKSLYSLMAGLIMAIYDFISDSPNEVPLIPYAAQDVCCP